MSRLKFTGFITACGGVTEAVLVVLNSQAKEAKIAKVRNSRVLKLMSPQPHLNVRPELPKLYPKGERKSTVTFLPNTTA